MLVLIFFIFPKSLTSTSNHVLIFPLIVDVVHLLDKHKWLHTLMCKVISMVNNLFVA
jgi:hypothetical protein